MTTLLIHPCADLESCGPLRPLPYVALQYVLCCFVELIVLESNEYLFLLDWLHLWVHFYVYWLYFSLP